MGKSEKSATRRRSSTSRPGTLKRQAEKKFSEAELRTSQKSVSGSRSSFSEVSVEGGDLVSRRPSAPLIGTVGQQRGRKFTATELASVEEDPEEATAVPAVEAPPSVLQSVFKFTTGLFHGQDTKR
jgi:hypothetical protein